MGKSRAMSALITLLVLSLLMLLLMYSLSYIPLFTITSIRVYGAEAISDALSDEISSMYGSNRFSVDLGRKERVIESYSQVKSAALKWNFPDEVDVYITETDQKCLLSDGTSCYLIEDGVITRVDKAEEKFLSSRMTVIEILPEYASYMMNYGIRDEIEEVISLAGLVRDEHGQLITRIKYDNNNGDGFGQMTLYLDTLSAQLFVKERVSKNRISDSIKVIAKEAESEVTRYTRSDIIRYDLYKDALVKRTSAGELDYGKGQDNDGTRYRVKLDQGGHRFRGQGREPHDRRSLREAHRRRQERIHSQYRADPQDNQFSHK